MNPNHRWPDWYRNSPTSFKTTWKVFTTLLPVVLIGGFVLYSTPWFYTAFLNNSIASFDMFANEILIPGFISVAFALGLGIIYLFLLVFILLWINRFCGLRIPPSLLGALSTFAYPFPAFYISLFLVGFSHPNCSVMWYLLPLEFSLQILYYSAKILVSYFLLSNPNERTRIQFGISQILFIVVLVSIFLFLFTMQNPYSALTLLFLIPILAAYIVSSGILIAGKWLRKFKN